MEPDPTLRREDRPPDETEDAGVRPEEPTSYPAGAGGEDLEAEARREEPTSYPADAGGEDTEAEARREPRAEGDEGPLAELKKKGQELLDKVSGPDVPPSLTDEDKDPRP
jgi:hypothetical protein